MDSKQVLSEVKDGFIDLGKYIKEYYNKLKDKLC